MPSPRNLSFDIVGMPWLLRSSVLLGGFLFTGILMMLSVGTACGDSLQMLSSDTEAIAARAELIDGAEHEICVAYYAIDTGRVPTAILGRLRDAARRGVRVRLLVDGLLSRLPSDFEQYLIRNGVQIRHFHPPFQGHPRWLNRRLHDKLIVTDRNAMIVGSRNLLDRHFGLDESRYLDLDAFVRGSAAECASRYFEWLWNTPDVRSPRKNDSIVFDKLHLWPPGDDSWRKAWRRANTPCDYERMITAADAWLQQCVMMAERDGSVLDADRNPTVPIEVLHDRYTDKRDRQFQDHVIRLIRDSRRRVLIESPYPVFTPPLVRAVLDACRRGVTVTLMTNSLSSTDRACAYAAYQHLKRDLLRAGVQIWELNGPEHLHAKSMVIDGRIAFIGSYNFDPRSDRLNLELAIAAHDVDEAAELTCAIKRHFRSATRVTDARPVMVDPPPQEICVKRTRMQMGRLLLPIYRWLL